MKRLALALSCLGAAAGCGYHAVYGGEAERLRVVLVRSLVPDAVACDEVVSGVREELAREGALAPGDGYPRVEVEVLRADEASEGVAAPSAALGGSASNPGANEVPMQAGPRARATEVGLVARACLVRARGGECERDTGDVRAMDLGASDVTAGVPDVVSDAFHHRDLARDVGKRLGERLARHILGEPTASDEAVGRDH
jgi:hypothetical protein